MNMDIFNRKRVKELEEEVKKLQREKAKLQWELDGSKHMVNNLRNSLADVIHYNETVPEDCKRGTWCAGCEFSKRLTIWTGYPMHSENYHKCLKGESCPNFVQKEVKD